MLTTAMATSSTIPSKRPARIKREPRLLLGKALNSLILSIEHFNRPSDQGRVEAVLILLDHSFEMLLKAGILQRGGKIRQRRAKQTIGFDECVRVGFSNASVKFLSQEDVFLLQTINSLRDAAQHHLIDISEQHLYIQCQAGLTLFRRLLREVFKKEISKALPSRVLPLSTSPPTDLAHVFNNEIEEVRKLLLPGKRHRIDAIAKLRSLAIVEGSLMGLHVQPGESELNTLARAIKNGKSWEDIFPGVASINITATGTGPSLDLKIAKTSGLPVTLVPEGTPGAAVLAVKRVDELSFYSLGRNQLSEKVGLSPDKTSAFIWFLKLQDDTEYHKLIEIGKSAFHRYSSKAISKIKEAVKEHSAADVWGAYKKRKKS